MGSIDQSKGRIVTGLAQIYAKQGEMLGEMNAAASALEQQSQAVKEQLSHLLDRRQQLEADSNQCEYLAEYLAIESVLVQQQFMDEFSRLLGLRLDEPTKTVEEVINDVFENHQHQPFKREREQTLTVSAIEVEPFRLPVRRQQEQQLMGQVAWMAVAVGVIGALVWATSPRQTNPQPIEATQVSRADRRSLCNFG